MSDDQKCTCVCYQESVRPANPGAANQESRRKRKRKSEVNTMTKSEEDNYPKERESFKRETRHENVECVPFTIKEPTKTFRVGRNLERQHTSKLVELIREFIDVFARVTEDMPGVNKDIALHRLHVDPLFILVKQWKRTFSEEKNLAIREEVASLLKAGAIRELQFPSWIANLVLVEKPNNKWRMCIYFKNLNKACPKYFYPLPWLGRLVDGSAGHEVCDFMDASRGYHQIRMLPKDEEETTFITDYDLYCKRVMPFGLKNVVATYQWMVYTILEPQIGHNMKIYVDDMLFKIKVRSEHLENLKETFVWLKLNRLKLNPEKCSFGVTFGKFLGYMMSERGIEPNPDKIKALLEMKPPNSYKDIQKLTDVW
ncbi:hypothetical protein LIER_34606 [Lithospermum erythrorhizon]|uniref:Reverse transcriptase domain-containing protein n=1 Tax=Lithospermum erythrorhizon TaxID=34254 RepID=A0AAV3S006_LITER